MKKSIFLFIILYSLFFIPTFGQLTFVIDSLPDYTPPEDFIYIAGDFNGWEPGLPEFQLAKNDQDKWEITLEEQAQGTIIQFKFTRGDWETVEKDANGLEIPNRTYTYGNGDTVGIIIYNWRDHGGGGGSTAAENVSIIDDDFYMPQLDRYRRIWIYLPPDYEQNDEEYPVLYMHDGQNLFDAETSYLGEWEVDETLNELFDEGYNVPIVVGIDNGELERVDEYTPWPNPSYGGGDGALYIDFIVETMKPYIDENYRTISGRESTGIMGSSLGGLISHYGGLKFQEIFSKVGIYSPSYWWSDSLWIFTNEMGKQYDMKLYLMAGSLEGSGTVENMLAMHDTLNNLGFGEDEVISKVIEGGEHNEALWRYDFREAYLWMFYSYATDIDDHNGFFKLDVFPNPAHSCLHINIPGHIGDISSLQIFSLNGRSIIKQEPYNDMELDIDDLTPGLYFIIVESADGFIYQAKFLKL